MIFLDAELDPRAFAHPAPKRSTASTMSVWGRAPLPWAERLPIPRTLNRFLVEAQDAIGLRGQVSVLLTTNRAIRSLNRRFRGVNKATDVLSFPANPIPGLKATDIPAGDLAISVQIARRQAGEQGHALTCELKILILHGLLHLAGYDHETDNGRMARRERLLRAKLGLPQGLIERSAGDRRSEGDGLQPVGNRQSRRPALAAEGTVLEPPKRASEAKAPHPRNGQTYGLMPVPSTAQVAQGSSNGCPILAPAAGRKGGKARTRARSRP
jgi:probable rRNA maturation factor